MRMTPTHCKLLWLTVFSWSLTAVAQPMLSGAVCVHPGVPYQYLVKGQWDSASTMQVCVNGAVILGSTGPSAACTTNGAPVAAVSVTWNTGVGSGSLSLTSTSGNTTLNVTISKLLQGGVIDSLSGMQSVGYNLAPGDIHCGPDSGGACKPVYVHQWQSSPDNIHWVDITGATGQNLSGIPAQKQTIFYRRKTVETVSSDIAYSNSAEVMVDPPPATTVTPIN
jgi:hypothetical protein